MGTDARLHIRSAEGGTTLQDAGRHGYLRYGITPAGPMDPLAFASANLAVDNPTGTTAIEISLGGLSLTVADAPVDVALVGNGFRIDCDGQPLPCATALTLNPLSHLTVRAGQAGSWCYLAAAGRIDAVPKLGSTATHTRSGFGGVDGRALGAGDVLTVTGARAVVGEPSILIVPWLERPAGTVRVVLGPQDDYFDADVIAAFLVGSWRIGARGDRMACFLEGAPVQARSHDIVSDGIAMGSIQVPGTGQPIVLMADRQPTGGYPKIATVIRADLGVLAQARAGDVVRFVAVSVEEAVSARRKEREALMWGIVRQPIVRKDFTSEFLLSRNLIDGVVG